MTKKVVIAAAGQGTRMLHLSQNRSKHLIEVENRPFLAYLLDNLLKAGFRELVLVVGFKENLMKDFVDSYRAPDGISDFSIKLVSQFEILGPKEKEYGTACPVKCVKDIVGRDNFIYINGDNLYSVRDLEAMNIDDDYNYVAGIFHNTPEKYGVLIKDGDDFLEKIIEKPQVFSGNIINTGLYKLTEEAVRKAFEIGKSPRGEFEITDVINMLSAEKKVKVREIKDYWLDFGNPGDVEKVAQFVRESVGKK